MWSEPDTRSELRTSDIACHLCRRRKVKCDRSFPRCQVCIQAEQTCEYPSHPKKPGPKIGSLQRQKRRYRDRDDRKDGRQSRKQASNSREGSHTDAETRTSTQAQADRAYDEDDEGQFLSNGERSSPTTRDNDWTKQRRNSKLNINDLSFTLHPCHEASTPEKDTQSTPNKDIEDPENAGLIEQVCVTLGITRNLLRHLIQVYFEYMVAINLFHQPSFAEKLGSISSPVEFCALLAAMLGFAARFRDSETSHGTGSGILELDDMLLQSPEHFVDLAQKFIDQALAECGDEAPSLCILQAYIVTTHCQLTRGVHGKAWRSLGMCVRLAYELNLHLVDTRGIAPSKVDDTNLWRDAEEKRRAWWAVWEMDVFASTIRRTPTAVDWAQMEVLLPVDDADWFQNRPSASAFMERDPTQRWKALQATGNQSPKAWFLVINSLMKDAQIISSPRGVPFQSESDQRQQRHDHTTGKPRGSPSCTFEDARQKLEILANSVYCFVLAMPSHLRYRNQYLSFEGPAPGKTTSLRQLHCGIYNIYVMTQLARLMIHRYDLFGGQEHHRQFSAAGKGSSTPQDLNSPAVGQYFESADNILTIINRSCEEHIQHINPFLPSTIWLAAAVQLVRKHVGWGAANPALVKSRFDVLYLTYKRCVSFWDAKTAMEQNLESMEMQLEGQNEVDHGGQKQVMAATKEKARTHQGGKEVTSWTSNQASRDSVPSNKSVTRTVLAAQPPASKTPSSVLPNGSAPSQGRLLPDTPPASIIGDDGTAPQQLTPSSHGHQQSSMNYFRIPMDIAAPSQKTFDATADLSSAVLSFMQLPPRSDRDQLMPPPPPPDEDLSDLPSSMMNAAALYDPSQTLGIVDMQQHNLEARNLDLPVDIHDLLSGFSTY